MPDITMCEGKNCPIKENCYRYTAKPNEYRQSYFVTPPYQDGKCEHFWGEAQESILQHLTDIVNGNKNA
jgi:hypothetical protein